MCALYVFSMPSLVNIVAFINKIISRNCEPISVASSNQLRNLQAEHNPLRTAVVAVLSACERDASFHNVEHATHFYMEYIFETQQLLHSSKGYS